MTDALLKGRDLGHPLHELTGFIHGPDFLRFAVAVTGAESAVRAEAQASYYNPGDFIGLHDDTSREAGNRLVAYTLGFTRRWRSDWGGQLLFHDGKGDVERGLVPRWNTLTLFGVPRLHSVAPVAAYAGAPRISVVGWLRDDPAPRI
ncbi:MAG TPA: 2OG-Fe(II) oxygenase family protein [Terricaulis sp.]|nr:2OG-Fe(II) oxygenase family protein [Terricaulis sp.]